jgi:hypothetical protein
MRLYKYFSIPKENFFTSKEHHKISEFMFMNSSSTPPKYFNDPCDSYIYFDSADNEYLRKVFSEQLQSGYYSEGVTRDILNEIFRVNNPHDIPDIFLTNKDPHNILERCFPDGTSARLCLNTVRQLQVSCFSSKSDNMLMWSHYSSDHSGICIGFDIDEEEFGIDLQKVIYTTEIPDKIPFKIMDDSNEPFIRYLLTKQIITKSIDWLYEDEYRLITFYESMGKRSSPVPARPVVPKIESCFFRGFKTYKVKEVILGYRCNNENEVCNMIKHAVCSHATRVVNDSSKKRPTQNEIDDIIEESIRSILIYRITGINKDYSLNKEKINYPNELFKRPLLPIC